MAETPAPVEKPAEPPAPKPEEKLPYRERIKAAVQKALKPAHVFLVKKLGEKRAARLLKVLEIPIRYYYEFKLKDDEQNGFALLRQFWNAGWLGRVGLFSVIFCTLLTALALGGQAQNGAVVEPGAANISSGLLMLSLATLTLGWAFGLTAAIHTPLWAYVLICAYLAWDGILAGGSLAGSLPFALPTLWMVYLGWRVARAKPTRWRWLWLLILGIGAGHLTFGAFGLARVVPEAYNLVGRIGLGILYFLLLNNRYTLGSDQKPASGKLPSRGSTFIGSLLAVGLFLALAAQQDAGGTAENLLLGMRSLLGIVDLFWFWLGWGLFDGGISLAEWVTKKAILVIRLRAARIVIPILWALCTLFGWLATHPIPIRLAVWSKEIGLQDWVFTWSDGLYFSVQGSVYAGIAVMVVAGVLALLHKLPQKRLVQLTSLWAASFLGLMGYYESLGAFATLEEDAAAALPFFAGLALVGGIVWELAKSSISYLGPRSYSRLMALTAILLLMLSISMVTLGAGLPDLVMEYTLYSFFGVIYLGIPLTLMNLFPSFTDYEPPDGTKLLGMFGLGCLSAVPALLIDPYAGPALLVVPVIWLLALTFLGKRLARLESVIDGALGGCALALGFVTFWMAPQSLPVPFLVAPNEWQQRYLSVPLSRPLLDDGQFWFTVVALLCGGLLGVVFVKSQRRVVRIGAGLAVCAVLALILPVLPGVPTAAPVAAEAERGVEMEPTPTPLPEGVIPENWTDAPLEGTGLAISLPPGWFENPYEVKDLLVNRFSPDTNALFSVRYYEGYLDVEEVAEMNLAAWRALQKGIEQVGEPEERTLGNWSGLWLETHTETSQSDSANVYVLIPGGTLHFNLLCAPGKLEVWAPFLEKIVASLRAEP